MSTEIALTALSIIGAVMCLFAGIFAIRPLKGANGSSALIQAIIFLSIIGFIWAGILCYNSIVETDRLPDSGIAFVFSLYARIKAILIASTLIFMIIRLKRARKEHDMNHEDDAFIIEAGD